MCDFYPDCGDASDEWMCGACDFESYHVCGWMQEKDDDFDWTRMKGPVRTSYTGFLKTFIISICSLIHLYNLFFRFLSNLSLYNYYALLFFIFLYISLTFSSFLHLSLAFSTFLYFYLSFSIVLYLSL